MHLASGSARPSPKKKFWVRTWFLEKPPTYKNNYRPEMLTARNFPVAIGKATVWQSITNVEAIQKNMTLNTNWPQQNKNAAGNAWRLLQYCQFSEISPSDVSRDIAKIFAVFQNLYSFIPWFLAEPLKMLHKSLGCGVTLVAKQA
jgi:hypothetical protein